MNQKLTIRDINLQGKKALIRVDFNVPLEKGVIVDDSRIQAALPTIQYVLENGGSAILMSHLGRPKGKRDAQFSLAPCAKRLSELLNRKVMMAPNCYGSEVVGMAKQLQPGEILLLENLRFHPGEEKPVDEPSFVTALASLGDLYVDDAFGSAHRPHASVTAITQFFPENSAMGFLMEREINYLGSVLKNPTPPFCAILGGSKISTKFKVIEALMKKADLLLIGGAMAFTFFKAENYAIGDSLVEDNFINVARELMDVGTQSRCKLLLPLDVVITNGKEQRTILLKNGIPAGFKGVDIGPETIKVYKQELEKCKTIFWNGPLGVFESPPFDRGTLSIAQCLADMQGKATTIVGGGDTVAAIKKAGVAEKLSHLSTGGGASLEYIEFGTLPGIEALTNNRPLA